MNDKFKENFTPLPNIIIDEAMRELSPTALVCYLIINRKTRGCIKTIKSISTNEFMIISGFKDKRTIYKSIKELEDFNLIIKTKTNNSTGNNYQLLGA